jgi:hypothetical protein
VATSRSSPSSEPPAWLGEVYGRRRRRTLRLVELSIAALTRADERASLARLANDKLPESHHQPVALTSLMTTASASAASVIVHESVTTLCAPVMAELIERLPVAEQGHADMKARWLKTADELLVWIIVVDRFLVGQSPQTKPSRPKKHRSLAFRERLSIARTTLLQRYNTFWLTLQLPVGGRSSPPRSWNWA